MTYHNAMKFLSVYTMHSTTIVAHGFEFVDRMANGYQHTDYRLELASSNLFVESERNAGGKIEN